MQQLLTLSIAVSECTGTLECRIHHLLLSTPNMHLTSCLDLDSRQLKILCSLLMFFDDIVALNIRSMQPPRHLQQHRQFCGERQRPVRNEDNSNL
jgi:hypothetical protein